MVEQELIDLHITQVKEHKALVKTYIYEIIEALKERAETHDDSKLENPEIDLFASITHKLNGTTYGSKEYSEGLKALGPALAHHYSVNSHHPESFKTGILEMDIVEIIEMLCDWQAAVKRHKDGSILKSLDINRKRFNISDDLFFILVNTCCSMQSRYAMVRKITSFKDLQIGWCYGRGKIFNQIVIDKAIEIARKAIRYKTVEVDAFPGENGEVQVNLYREDENAKMVDTLEIIISLNDSGFVEVSYYVESLDKEIDAIFENLIKWCEGKL